MKKKKTIFTDIAQLYNSAYKSKKVRSVLFVLSLIFCFPLGLYILWTKKPNISLTRKAVISTAVAIFVIAVFLISMPPDNNYTGSVVLVRNTPNTLVYGPGIPDDADGRINTYQSADEIILMPTVTPEPLYVYCNDMGKYYHLETCRYVKETTPRVTLRAALEGGFQPCKDCRPPEQ